MRLGLGLGVTQFRPAPSGGAVQIAHNTQSLFGDILEGDDFSSHVNYNALIVSLTARFSYYIASEPTGGEIVTFDGAPQLKCSEVSGSQTIDMGLIFPSGMSKLWARSLFTLSPTYTLNNGKLYTGTGITDSGFSSQSEVKYSMLTAGPSEKWTIGPEGITVDQSLASLKGRELSVCVLGEVIANRLHTSFFLDGDLTGGPTGDTGEPITALDTADVSLGPFSNGTPDPTNNYVHYRLFEFVNGDTYPNPYGLL